MPHIYHGNPQHADYWADDDPLKPVRVQRRRTRGWRMPPNTICVSRPSKYGNPFRVDMWRGYLAADAVRDFRRWLARDPIMRSADIAFGKPPSLEEIKTALRGKNLACWCPMRSHGEYIPCHADVLLEVANS